MLLLFLVIHILMMYVCVLTSFWTNQYDWIMRWWYSKPQPVTAWSLDYSAYYYILFPVLTKYSSQHCSYHTSLSAHLGVLRLQTIFYACHTRSFAYLCFSSILISMPNYQPALPLRSGDYYVTVSALLLLLLASHEIPSRVAWIFSLSPIVAIKRPSCALPLRTISP